MYSEAVIGGMEKNRKEDGSVGCLGEEVCTLVSAENWGRGLLGGWCRVGMKSNKIGSYGLRQRLRTCRVFQGVYHEVLEHLFVVETRGGRWSYLQSLKTLVDFISCPLEAGEGAIYITLLDCLVFWYSVHSEWFSSFKEPKQTVKYLIKVYFPVTSSKKIGWTWSCQIFSVNTNAS